MKKKSITIRNLETGEILTFPTCTKCRLYLGVGKDVFWNFINDKPRSTLRKRWEVVAH